MIFSLTYHKIKNVGSGSSPGNDFRLFFFFFFFLLPTALAVGFLSEESFTSSVFIGGLLCGRPPGARDP